MKKNQKKSRAGTVILVLLMLTGLSLILYPTVANYWNSYHASHAIATYAEDVAHLDDDAYERILQAAVDYNEALKKRGVSHILTEEQQQEYLSTLDITGTGIMGYIEIEEIGVALPVYHGVSEGVLQIAAGHVEWSSLPVGGLGTHCVLSGHRGLPSAKLFTELDRLTEGDTFTIRVLDEVLTYEIDQILIVLPRETEALAPVEGEDYLTLVTCTPYGINTHRLLVRGHRIETQESAASIRVTADAIEIDPLMVAPVVAVPLILLMLAVFSVLDIHYKRRKRIEERLQRIFDDDFDDDE